MSRASRWLASHPGQELPCYLRGSLHNLTAEDGSYIKGRNAAKRARRALNKPSGPAKTPKGLKGK